jgi:hypothetical protein
VLADEAKSVYGIIRRTSPAHFAGKVRVCMRLIGRGVAVLTIRTGTLLMSGAFILSLLLSSASYALSLDPTLDTVTSLVISDTTDSKQTNDQHGGDKPPVNSRPATTSSAANSATATLTNVPESTPAVVAEPLQPLPSIVVTDISPQNVRASHSVPSLALSHTARPASANTAIPLQASNHGWKLFGVVWYWWVLIPSAGYYLVWRFKHAQHRQTCENVV